MALAALSAGAVLIGGNGNGLRVEAELGYGKVDGDSIEFLGLSANLDADVELLSATVGAFYDFNIGGGVAPYVGAGIGVIHQSVDDISAALGGTTVTAEGDDETDLTAFAEAGLAFPIARNIEIVPAYRFQWIDNGAEGFDDNFVHIAKIGLRFGF